MRGLKGFRMVAVGPRSTPTPERELSRLHLLVAYAVSRADRHLAPTEWSALEAVRVHWGLSSDAYLKLMALETPSIEHLHGWVDELSVEQRRALFLTAAWIVVADGYEDSAEAGIMFELAMLLELPPEVARALADFARNMRKNVRRAPTAVEYSAMLRGALHHVGG
ncbi:MAG: hypothetical protein HC923_12675 [Myxococcales bacterium]|nr:hypothetical protein [Myxococcales bacterium]